jgi:hypothetical protein
MTDKVLKHLRRGRYRRGTPPQGRLIRLKNRFFIPNRRFISPSRRRYMSLIIPRLLLKTIPRQWSAGCFGGAVRMSGHLRLRAIILIGDVARSHPSAAAAPGWDPNVRL